MEAVGEVEEASCLQGAAGEEGTSPRKLARVEEAEDLRGVRGQREGLQEQQLPVSAGTALHNLNNGQENTYRMLPDHHCNFTIIKH